MNTRIRIKKEIKIKTQKIIRNNNKNMKDIYDNMDKERDDMKEDVHVVDHNVIANNMVKNKGTDVEVSNTSMINGNESRNKHDPNQNTIQSITTTTSAQTILQIINRKTKTKTKTKTDKKQSKAMVHVNNQILNSNLLIKFRKKDRKMDIMSMIKRCIKKCEQ